jgi:hypothetical protein
VGTPFTSTALTVKEDRRWADDDILVVYAPGSSKQEFPLTMGKFIPAGSDLVFRAQYTINGVAGSDQSSVGLVFSKEEPSRRIITLALEGDRRFTIPPNVSDYRVEARGVLRRDVLLVSLFPLLHLRGKRFEYDLIHTPSRARDNLSPAMETHECRCSGNELVYHNRSCQCSVTSQAEIATRNPLRQNGVSSTDTPFH